MGSRGRHTLKLSALPMVNLVDGSAGGAPIQRNVPGIINFNHRGGGENIYIWT